MRKISKVPNGPLIKKKGQFKGSTLKSGGTVKKAQVGVKLTPQQKRAQLDSIAAVRRADIVRKKDSILDRNAAAKGMTREEVRAQQKKDARKPDAQLPGLEIDKACKRGKTTGSCSTGESNRGESLRDTKRNGGKVMKNGGKTPAWQRKEGKNPSGGLNAKGRASYNRETGGNLKAPQPQGGSRKKSFCARMSGMKKKLTSSKTANNPNSRINKSLRKWKC
jgi:hypothetical protein